MNDRFIISSQLRRRWQRARALRLLALWALALVLCAALRPHTSEAVRPQQAPTAPAPARFDGKEAAFVPGEVLVRFRADKQAALAALTLSTEAGALNVHLERFAGSDLVPGLRIARVAPDETARAVAALSERADVLYAEPNYLRRPFRTPNEPRFAAGDLWGLKNTIFTGWDIGAEAAWNTTTGSRDVVVGVIDEGVDINHPDLAPNIWHNPGEVPGNNFDDDGNGFVDDVTGWDFFHNDNSVYDGPGTSADGLPLDGHGTHVAGTIGAVGDNGVGVVGVNWQVSLLPLKFIGPADGRSSDLLRAFAYARALRERGVNLRVLNNSYGGGGRSQAEFDAIRALGDAGILFVVAAGNESSDNDHYPVYPANYVAPNVISVAATAKFQSEAAFSNYGPRTVHMHAPGDQVLSTIPGGYALLSGTSMAAPHVAGTAALVAAAHPDFTLARLRAAVLYSGPGYFPNPRTTISNTRLSAANAMQNATEVDTTAPAAAGQFRLDQNATTNDPMFRRLLWTTPGDDGIAGRIAHYELRFSPTDPSTPAQFEQAYPLAVPTPQTGGFTQEFYARLPYRRPDGYIGIRAIDNAGNAGPISTLPVSIPAENADPYILTESAAAPLSTGGTPLNLRADDRYRRDYFLPFRFTFFNGQADIVTVSSNGAIYFTTSPPIFPNGDAADALTTAESLAGTIRIAGLLDDLRTDTRPGDDVYVVVPDDQRVIFRWQAVTYNTRFEDGTTRGENPVNFEIELRRDGAIIIRYGDGNQRLLPIVGLGGGEPEPYVVASHTSEAALVNLTNAPTVVFTRRRPIPPPMPDLALTMTAAPTPAEVGRRVQFTITANNRSQTETALGVVVTDVLPPGFAFVSCDTPFSACSAAPPVGGTGSMTANLGVMGPGSRATVTVVAQVTAPPATPLYNSATITARFGDPDPSNNTAGAWVDVAAANTFGGVRAIAAGVSHTLALKPDGTVWAWGNNGQGQLGNGSNVGGGAPVQVSGLSGVAAVAAGNAYSIALKTDGTVWTWGTNSGGQLGVGSSSVANRNVPGQVAGLTNVTAIVAGYTDCFALKADGTVWAWGVNNFGELGIGPQPQGVLSPTQVPALSGVTRIAAASGHTLAVKSDGTVLAFGANNFGQLGQPVSNPIPTPTAVAGLTDVVEVSCRSITSFALRRDGTVWAWGAGGIGERGDGTTDVAVPVPRRVVNLSGVTALASGNAHALALKSDGTLWAWGDNLAGALGDGTTTARSAPVRVAGLDGVVACAAGVQYGVALLGDGSVRAWGSNSEGQLGDRYIGLQPNPFPLLAGITLVAANAPTFSPAGGSYLGARDVAINAPEPGMIVRYSTNGVEPNENATLLNPGETIRVAFDQTIKARAWKDGLGGSAVASASYRIGFVQPGVLRYETSIYQAAEGDGRATIKVVRTGDSSATATVEAVTSDDPRAIRCDDTINSLGNAFARCDYATTIETLTFAPGETQKTFTVPLIDDAHVEPTEGLGLGLRNATGAQIDFTNGSIARLIITDNDAPAGANPIFNNNFFVRQHYLDFLSREPEQTGLDAWLDVLSRCPDVNNDPGCDRILVSSSFFGSPEFQLKGFFVYKFYKVMLGRLPTYNEITSDMRRVTGQTAEEVFAKRTAYANEWVRRQEFHIAYDGLSQGAFVGALLQNVGLTPTGAVTRESLIEDLRAGRKTRADVLRAIIEHPDVDAREFNGAFVAMQYYGYLRRDPEVTGYNAWLTYLNTHPGDFRTMVNGFMNSQEYKLRFGREQ